MKEFNSQAQNGQALNGYHSTQAPRISRAQYDAIAHANGLTIQDGENWRGPNPFTQSGEDGFVWLWSSLVGSDRSGDFTKSPREMLEFFGASIQTPPVSTLGAKAVKTEGKTFDTRSLEERGLTAAARARFGVSEPRGVREPWGEYRQFPTRHPDGSEGRERRKFRDPSRQPTTTKDGKPRRQVKTLWDKATEANGQPIAYNLDAIEAGGAVYLVNSELAVWLYWQEGLTAICPLGEGRSEQSYRAMLEVAKNKGAASLTITLDADPTGESATERAIIAARAVEMPAKAKTWPHPGDDASDFHERWKANPQGRTFGRALDELPDRAEVPEVAPTATEQPAPMFPRLKLREIFSRPNLEDLVEDFLRERTTSIFGAEYGAFKSFVLLDIGLSVATGRKWQGRKVKQGRVVYIVAEGAYETKARAQAWLQYHSVDEVPEDFEIIEIPVQIVQFYPQLIEELRDFAPILVIVDTVAQCNIGRDENSTGEAGEFTNAIRTICRELGAHVACAHHNGKSGQLRGNTSFPANLDTSITMKKSPGRVVTIECDRTKGAAFEPFSLIGRVVELSERNEHGRNITSLVFEATDAPTTTTPELPKADQTREQVFEALRNAPEGLTATKWQEKSGLSSSPFYTYRQALVEAGRVTQKGRIYQVTPFTPFTPFRSEKEHSNHSFYSFPPLGEGVKGVNAGANEGAAEKEQLFEDEPDAPNDYGHD